jgi:N6-adenosine-specific RNA methylase IME4
MDGATQPRAELNQAHLEELVELLRDGGTFKDPVVVFYDGTNHWLADGFHRINATKLAGLDTVGADVRSGTLENAVEFSCGANATHGLRRTNGDKRRAVTRLLSLPKWQIKSNREIAKQCGVTEFLVRTIRAELPDDHPAAIKSQNPANQPEKPIEEVEEVRNFRTNEDKRKAVVDFFADYPTLEHLSNREIARRCGVDEGTVRNYKKELLAEREREEQEKAAQESPKEPDPEPEPIEAIADPVTEMDAPATLDEDEEDEDHDYGDEKNEEEAIPYLRYYLSPYPALCKHCSETHFDWSLDQGDWWFCGKCNHATNDEFMQIDKNYKAPVIPVPEPEPVEGTATPADDTLHAFISDVPVDQDVLTETMLDMAEAIREQVPDTTDLEPEPEPQDIVEDQTPTLSPETIEALAAIQREREIKRQQVEERNEQLREKGVDLPTGKYSCIVIDPPWQMQKIEREERPNQMGFDYPTMSEKELEEFPLPALAADNCHLYLWVTQKHLPLALRLAEHWGFKYQCIMTWVKNVGFTPFSWMYTTEHVLFCTKGSLPLLAIGKRLDFGGKVREHSRKPDEFYNLVKEVSPGPRIDVFSREKRDGFKQYGNEVEKYVSA